MSNDINPDESDSKVYLENGYLPAGLAESKRTFYDLQEFPKEKGPAIYVLSESETNTGLGFDNRAVRDGVAQYTANGIREVYDCRPSEIVLFQQRPDGDFDRVQFRYIGMDGQSEADLERQAAQPGWKPEEPPPGREPQMSEYRRDVRTREEVENVVAEPLMAPQETHQQRQEALLQQWHELGGPSIDRAAEQSQRLEQGLESYHSQDR